MSLRLPLLALAASLASSSYAATYDKVAFSMQGDSFFDQWDFQTTLGMGGNRNSGNALFLDQPSAKAANLTFINSAGEVVIKVDDTNDANPADTAYGRPSLYLISKETVKLGSLILFQASHVPVGCSVWPAFFTQGAGVEWPERGEIDIYENVNLATTNQYSLHTTNGCTHPGGSDGQSGKLISTDCYNVTNGNQGCITQETKPNSFGVGLNNANGGAWATEYASTGIKTWFFPKDSIPSDFSGSAPNPDNWGLPSAFFPASSCDLSTHFGPQNLILDIDICGSFGSGAFTSTGCTGECQTLVKTASNYKDAYFEIGFVKVLTSSSGSSGGNSSTGNGNSGGSGSSNNNTGSDNSNGGNNGGNNPAVAISASMMLTAAAVVGTLFSVGVASCF